MKRIIAAFGVLFAASALLVGCATVELSSPGEMKNGDRLLVIQNDGYLLFWVIPLWSGELTWNDEEKSVNCAPVFFKNNSDTSHFYEMARKIAERENCDLVDVTFIDNFVGLNLSNCYGAIRDDDLTLSAVLRPRK